MNNILNNKHSVFGDLGDFWYRQQSETNPKGVTLARALSHLGDNNNAISKMAATIQRLSGEGEVYKSNFTLSFNPAAVRILNFNINQRYTTGSYPSVTSTKPVKYSLPNTGAIQVDLLPVGADPGSSIALMDQALGDNDYGLFWFELEDADRIVTLSTDEARPLYFVPIPLGMTPLVITTPTRELATGCGFISGPGYLLFYEDPYTLFPESIICVRSATALESHVMDYTYQVDNVYSDGRYIAAYMRTSHSAIALTLALAEVAGLPILHEDSVLQNKYENYDNTIYEFDTQVITVPSYIEHTALTVGDSYTAGTIFGEEYVKVFSSSNVADTPWYRTSELDSVWSVSGLSLNTITPFSGITVPDAVGTFAYNGATGGGTAHYYLSGVTGSNTGSYWSLVRSSETYTDKYLADVAGVTLGATANCIDFYFENMLSYNAIVIKLRTQELGSERHQNVLSFIRRDLPINITPIILY